MYGVSSHLIQYSESNHRHRSSSTVTCHLIIIITIVGRTAGSQVIHVQHSISFVIITRPHNIKCRLNHQDHRPAAILEDIHGRRNPSYNHPHPVIESKSCSSSSISIDSTSTHLDPRDSPHFPIDTLSSLLHSYISSYPSSSNHISHPYDITISDMIELHSSLLYIPQS